MSIPELLTTIGGAPVTSVSDWETFRRPEIMDLLSEYIYGKRPAEAEKNLHTTWKITDTKENYLGSPVRYEKVLITAGATGALFTALLGILNPGEEVIIPTPAFGLYETITTIAGGKAVALDTKPEGCQITAESLAKVITPKTKAIILNSPNNPTGTVLSEASMAAVKEAVLGKPIFVICDNVYSRLSAPCPDLSTYDDLR